MRAKDPTLYLHNQKQSIFQKKGGEVYEHLLEFTIKDVPTQADEMEMVIDTALTMIDAVTQTDNSPLLA